MIAPCYYDLMNLQRIFACIFRVVGSTFKSSKWKGYSYSANQDIWPTPVCPLPREHSFSACHLVKTGLQLTRVKVPPVSGRMKLFEVSKLWTIDFLVNSFSQWSCDHAGWQWLGIPLSLLQWSSVRAPLSVSVTSTLCKSFFSICLRFACAFTSFWDLLQGQQGYLMYLCS